MYLYRRVKKDLISGCVWYFDKENHSENCRLQVQIHEMNVDCENGQQLMIMDGLQIRVSLCGKLGNTDTPMTYKSIGSSSSLDLHLHTNSQFMADVTCVPPDGSSIEKPSPSEAEDSLSSSPQATLPPADTLKPHHQFPEFGGIDEMPNFDDHSSFPDMLQPPPYDHGHDFQDVLAPSNKTGGGCICGKPPKMAPNHRIVGGTPASSPIPWQAAIVLKNDIICGGTVVAPLYILTAAHCFRGGLSQDGLEIVLGQTSIASEVEIYPHLCNSIKNFELALSFKATVCSMFLPSLNSILR